MKQILLTESACISCKEPKQQKEYRLELAKDSHYKITYETYIINDCKRCGKYTGKLR